MVNIKVLLQQIKLTFPMSLALMGFPQIQAQPTKPISFVQRSIISSNKQLNKPFIFDAPPLPPDVRTSSGRGAGGSRGCQKSEIIALAPVYKRLQDSKVIWGLTTEEHPTLWFYVPESLTSDRPGKLSLQNQQKEDINIPPLRVMGTLPGIVSIPLSPAIAPLEIGKTYRWSFRVTCDPRDSSGDIIVDGWLQRIKPDDSLKKQLEKAATSRERALLYAKAGIWYDSITELCRSHSKDANFAADWEALLQAIHLDEIAKAPIVPCGVAK